MAKAPKVTCGVHVDGQLAIENPHLAAEDLIGRDVTLIIKRLVTKGFKDESGNMKPVLEFHKTRLKDCPKLIPCKTSLVQIATVWGDAAVQWRNKPITIYPTTCNAFGNPNKPCIRVREVMPQENAIKKACEAAGLNYDDLQLGQTSQVQAQQSQPPSSSPVAPVTAPAPVDATALVGSRVSFKHLSGAQGEGEVVGVNEDGKLVIECNGNELTRKVEDVKQI